MVRVNINFIVNKANMWGAVDANPKRYANSLWMLKNKSEAVDIFNKFLEPADRRQTGNTLLGVLNTMDKEVFSPQKLHATLDFIEDITSNIKNIASKKGGV